MVRFLAGKDAKWMEEKRSMSDQKFYKIMKCGQ